MKKSLFTFLMVCYAVQSYSQNVSDSTRLQNIIIQGNRLNIPFNQSTRDIEVITAEEIAQLPVKSINELLTYVGGVDIQQHAPFGGQADISLDGGSSEQTLILLNGIKLINSQTAHNMMNLPVPVDAIDHIEILRGAAARVYGINALTGAINIVTKKTSKPFITASLQGGSSFKSKDEDDGKGIYGGEKLQLTGNYGDKNQRHLFAFGQDLYNGQRYNTAQKSTQAFYNGAYHFNTAHQIEVLAGYNRNRFGANGFYAAPGDKDSEEIVETAVFGLSSKHRLGNFTLIPRISDRYDKDDYRYFKHDLNTARSIHYTNALMGEINANLQTSIGEFGLGWESRFEKINSSNIGQHERNNHGTFLEYRQTFFDKLITNVGVYANYNTDYDWQVYPGIDAAYLFHENWKISASIGSGQRIPSFTDLYLNQPPGNIGNPNVEPENSWQYEAAIHFQKFGILAQTGVFYREIDDFIDWIRPDENTPYSPINFGENKVTGFYARIHQNFKLNNNQSLSYRLNYNYLNPKVSATDNNQSKYVLSTLKHQLIAGVNYRYQHLSIQLKNRYIKRLLNDPYDVLDARISYDFESFNLYTDITNIFNAKYNEAAAIPMPPRWFSLGIKYRWNKN